MDSHLNKENIDYLKDMAYKIRRLIVEMVCYG